MTESRGSVALRRRLLVVVALCCLASRQVRSASPVAELAPGDSRREQAAATEGLRYHIRIASGQAADLMLRQLDGLVELRVSGDTNATATEGPSPEGRRSDALVLWTDAGRSARIDATLLAAKAHDADSHWLISVVSRHGATRAGGATFEISLSPARSASDVDRHRATAVEAYAEAETLRKSKDRNAASRARADYDRAAREWQQGQDGCAVRRAYIGAARFENSLGNYAPARELAAKAVAAECANEIAEQAQAAKTLGMASGYLGDFSAAAAADEQAIDLYRRTGDLFSQGVTFGNLSAVYRELGATDKALEAAGEALRLASATGDDDGVVFSRESVAAIHLARGELGEALQTYRQTLKDLEATRYPMIEGQAWNDIGIVYHRLGDYGQALRAYAKAESVWAATDNRSGMAETAINEGEARLHEGKRALAAAAFMRALRIARADGFKSHEVHALRGLGACATEAGHWPEARSKLESSRDRAHQIGEVAAEGYAVRALGDLASRQRHFNEARREYQRAVELAWDAADLDGEAASLASLARADGELGELSLAKDAIERSLAIIETQRSHIGDPALRTSYFASARAYHELYIDILFRLDARSPTRDGAAGTLAAAERARTRMLQDMLAERAIAIDSQVDTGLAAAERAAEERLRTAAYQLARQSHVADAATRASLQSAVDTASRELDEARGRIRSTSPQYAELKDPQPLTSEELQNQLLDEDTALLEYWLGARRSYLWVATRHSLRVVKLPARSAIEPVADELRRRLLAREMTGGIEALAIRDAQSTAALHRLGKKLGYLALADALRGVTARNLVVVADGGLQLLPFGALVPPGSEQELRIHENLSYLPSLLTLRSLRRLPAAKRLPTLAVFADPVFRADDARIGAHRRAVPDERPRDLAATREAGSFDIAALPRLPYSRSEAQAIGAFLPAASTWLALDFAASRAAALTADWQRFSIVHFAAHTLIDLQNPELSGIVLSLYDRDGRPQDGFVRMNDIYNLNIPADLIVLSACDSGVGKSMSTEGIFSLSRAFFYAGAHRVLASLWAVDDRAAAAFMTDFYRALLVDKSLPAEALRSAQEKMSRDPRWSAAYYWAGFVLQGDWR
jgi:CHAT domain-containing protein